jgi:hypothetical protein
MRRGLAAVAGGALLAAVAGCAATPPAPTAATPTPSWTVRVLTAAPIKPKTAAPALKITGTAWPAILASLSGYGGWLLANPDPSLVAMIATPGCAMNDLLSRQVTALHEENAYVTPSPPVFSLVVGRSPAVTNEMTLDVTASRPAEPVLAGPKATVISSFAALPPTSLQITLVRGADNKWRFCTVNAIADTGDGSDPSVPLL